MNKSSAGVSFQPAKARLHPSLHWESYMSAAQLDMQLLLKINVLFSLNTL